MNTAVCRFLVYLACLIAPVLAQADPVSVTLDPIRHSTAALTVAGPAGEVTYNPSELEALGAARLTTVTPWRETEATFDGVLLTDVLAANGLSEVDAIRVVAENDYAVVITSDVWKRWPILVATRVDGAAHSRRNRGPIQFVQSMSEHVQAGSEEHIQNWVWMAARIEAAN